MRAQKGAYDIMRGVYRAVYLVQVDRLPCVFEWVPKWWVWYVVGESILNG